MIYERLNQLERGCHDLPSLNLAQGADPFVTPLCLTSKLTWFRVSKLKHSDTVFAINIYSPCPYTFSPCSSAAAGILLHHWNQFIDKQIDVVFQVEKRQYALYRRIIILWSLPQICSLVLPTVAWNLASQFSRSRSRQRSLQRHDGRNWREKMAPLQCAAQYLQYQLSLWRRNCLERLTDLDDYR